MTSSSAPQSYSITSSDTITFDTSTWSNISAVPGSVDTITISNGGSSTSSYSIGNASGTYTNNYIGSGATVGGITSIGTINNISGGAGNTFTWAGQVEFVNCLPDFDRIEKMCEEYPGLKIAYEKFKTTYKLVADHYDTPKDKRPKP